MEYGVNWHFDTWGAYVFSWETMLVCLIINRSIHLRWEISELRPVGAVCTLCIGNNRDTILTLQNNTSWRPESGDYCYSLHQTGAPHFSLVIQRWRGRGRRKKRVLGINPLFDTHKADSTMVMHTSVLQYIWTPKFSKEPQCKQHCSFLPSSTFAPVQGSVQKRVHRQTLICLTRQPCCIVCCALLYMHSQVRTFILPAQLLILCSQRQLTR